ncbi:hypothetical protein HNP65_001518 [Thermosipho japonicus]|uniref:Uncharacterized protein n=1 Tax=Thermosipho japonicus TaxID=90323 RepID=A0A841GM21_9BACT|nr:hypothetical protein [Thermosipho japonicus]MBB6063055.1 hypothetical protein [Thermosipho japonicus]
MKKRIVIFFLIIIVIQAFSLPFLNIRPKHEEGPFVEFTSLGYAFKNSEILTQPLLDILGIFNLNYRYYVNNNGVFSTQNYFIDPFFVSRVYMNEPIEGTPTYIFATRNYYFSNYYLLDRISIKSYFEMIFPGITDFSDCVFAIVPRGFINVGYFVLDKIEIFSSLEGGVILNLITSSRTKDINWDNFIQELRQESIYSTFKFGVSWYYDNYSGIEVGYRLFLWGKESPLRFIQGFTITDWIYNYISYTLYTENSQEIFIPFITTDYYISFSTKF